MNRTVFASFTTAFLLCLLSTLFAAGFVLNVQTVKADGVFVYIWANGSVEGTTYIQTADEVTYNFTNNINGSIMVYRNNIVINGNGYTLQGSGSGTGIDLSETENVTVRNTQIKNFESGILLGSPDVYGYPPNYHSISGNNIGNNNYGIQLYSSSNNSISGNNMTNNSYGMNLESSFNNSISRNNITANNDSGIRLYSSSSNSISVNNVTANSYYGILLASSSNNSISRNTFTDDGLSVWDSYQNSVEDNTVNGKSLVYLEGAANYSVGDAGQVVLVRCDRIRVENLNLSRTTVGVQLCETNNSIISWNNITANSLWGILLYSSSNNSISVNNVANNFRGIWLDSASNYNSISDNNITANNDGGVCIVNSSSGNRFYHNNFMDNSFQVFSDGLANVWDDGSMGNHWSDYQTRYPNATQTNGVWNTSYTIDANNTDHYPLANQIIIPEFPSITALPLFMLLTMLAVVFPKRKNAVALRTISKERSAR